MDVDVEVISSVVTWLSVLVDGVDGEDSWFVIDERDESRSFGVGLVSGGGLLDVGVEWSILDWVTVEGDLNGVVSWGSDGVFDIVGSVSVILDVWVNFLWASNVDLEGVSSLVDWFTLVVNGVDLEGKNVVGLSSVESRTFSPGVSGVTLLDEWVEWRSLDVVSVEGDGNGVVAWFGWNVSSLVGSVVLVVEVGWDLAVAVSLDVDVVWVVTGWHLVSVGVLGFDVEWGVFADLGSLAFNSWTVSGGVVGIWASDGWVEW